VLCRLYAWARQIAGFDLDDFLTAGKILDSRQVESLAVELRANADGLPADTGAFDHRLAVVEDFLRWSLDSVNRGGSHPFTVDRLNAERSYLRAIIQSLRIGGHPSNRIQPLEEEQIRAIRLAIGPCGTSADWRFPEVFAPHARLRNWLMFEVALELGIRRGELLKLRLDSLPRGAGDGILVLRRPDDPNDSRAHEPAVKTAERVLPASRGLLSAIRAYLTYPAPLRRVGRSPYLFVARSGAPLSCDSADDVIVAIGRASSITPLSWHRLRHTWAERTAEIMADQPNGMDRLVYLGGWRNASSAARYIQKAIAKQARSALQVYQQTLYQSGRGDQSQQ
jgi:integrase